MFKRRKADDDFDDWGIPDLPDDFGWDDEFGGGRRRGRRLFVLVALLLVAGALLAAWLVGRSDRPEEAAATPLLDATAAVIVFATPAVDTPAPTVAPAATPTAGAPTLAPPPTATPASDKPAPGVYDPAALAQYMLRLVNADRVAHGLAPVAWDETAALAGERHAADMVAQGYFSHWNTAGLGPDHRYALLGGEHAVMENLHLFSYTLESGGGAPIEAWQSVIEQAQAGLMLSPGHRANLLDPAHTHVGIGMAYDPASGEFRLAQEFTNHYAVLTVSPPAEAAAGSVIRVAGRFADGPLTNFILSLAFEPWPEAMTPAELNRTDAYQSAAESIDGRLVDRQFDEQLTLGGPGLYHVRLFADLPDGQALVLSRLIQVR